MLRDMVIGGEEAVEEREEACFWRGELFLEEGGGGGGGAAAGLVVGREGEASEVEEE